MWFVFAIQLIIALLMFQPDKCSSCDKVDWSVSLDRATWSRCPNTNTYLRGLWRSPRQLGDERVGRIEYGRCCTATEPSYTNQPAACSNANWLHTLDGCNVWALCPTGYYLNGLRMGSGPHAYLQHIDEGQCCHPLGHPNSYEHCYDEDVTHSFDHQGWSECQQAGYYMTGFYKSSCNDIYCIEKFRCCKMKKPAINGGWSAYGDWSECSVTCGAGQQERFRTCTNPPPSNCGAQCSGFNKETRSCDNGPCEVDVDGGWSNWSAYGECSKTCGGGRKYRTRTCTNPPKSGNGKDCNGKAKKEKICKVKPCKGY